MTDARRLRSLFAGPFEGSYPLPPDEDGAAFRAATSAALEALVASSTLDLADSEGARLGATLFRLATEPVAPFLREAVGAARLAAELVRSIADPGRINQGLKGTCAVTCVESYLAGTAPAEYARLLVGLMSPAGVVPLRNGDVFQRDEQLLRWSVLEARRSPVSRLFQVSAMEHAYPDLDYRNTWDGYVEAGDPAVPPPGMRRTRPPGLKPTGLDLDAFDRFLEGVTGERWDTLSDKAAHVAAILARLGLPTTSPPDLRRDGPGILRRSAAASEPTFVTVDVTGHPGAGVPLPPGFDPKDFQPMPHKVRVLDVDAARGRVVYEDPLDPEEPWLPGIETRVEDTKGRCSVALADFERLMLEISYKPRFWEPPGE